jgi:hypothetical protein
MLSVLKELNGRVDMLLQAAFVPPVSNTFMPSSIETRLMDFYDKWGLFADRGACLLGNYCRFKWHRRGLTERELWARYITDVWNDGIRPYVDLSGRTVTDLNLCLNHIPGIVHKLKKMCRDHADDSGNHTSYDMAYEQSITSFAHDFMYALVGDNVAGVNRTDDDDVHVYRRDKRTAEYRIVQDFEKDAVIMYAGTYAESQEIFNLDAPAVLSKGEMDSLSEMLALVRSTGPPAPPDVEPSAK